MAASLTGALPTQTAVWNEQNVLKNGMQFLTQKKDELDLYNKLWVVAISNNPEFYNSSAISAAKEFTIVAQKSKHEIEVLHSSVKNLLNEELSKDFYSEKSNQLFKIALAASTGLNYFTDVLENTRYPSLYNWGISTAISIGHKIFIPSCVTAIFVKDEILSSYASIALTIGMLTWPIFGSIHFVTVWPKTEPAYLQHSHLYGAFTKALDDAKTQSA